MAFEIANALPVQEAMLMDGFWHFVGAGPVIGDLPVVFERAGQVTGYRFPDAARWMIEEGELRFINAAGKPSWRFSAVRGSDGGLRLEGATPAGATAELRPWTAAFAGAGSEVPSAAAEEGAVDDQIKLVIWDLDETFWEGTLAEGGIRPISAHIELVKELTARGIVNAVCSKNHFEPVREALTALGVWDYFIFPRVAFAPKGAMIQDIISSSQLRAASVLFLDDNPVNINEALHYNPGLQTALPDAIPSLIADRRLRGKPDPSHKRLARYRILEEKVIARANSGTDNLAFLRQSGIRISFHHNIEAEFARVHDLVNRTNQLNFTKKRWPEEEAEARAVFAQEINKNFSGHCGYVKVSDRYGSYGICGFYLVQSKSCVHFLFSCRSINMGIEQFVWHKIGRPHVKVVGEVVARLGDLPDWITIVDDADAATEPAPKVKPLICVRGACDLSMMTHYLRTNYDILEEFPFPYKGFSILPVARAAAVQEEAESPAGAALLAKLPGFPPARFSSAVNSGEADVYILSFSTEIFCGRFRSRSTGMVLPIHNERIKGGTFHETSYAALTSTQTIDFSEEQWLLFQQELEFVGSGVDVGLSADIRYVFERLRGKIVIVLLLNGRIGRDRWYLNQFSKINEIVRPLAEEFGYNTVDLGEFVTSVDDLVNPNDFGAHFSRKVYTQVAAKVSEVISAYTRQQAKQAAA